MSMRQLPPIRAPNLEIFELKLNRRKKSGGSEPQNNRTGCIPVLSGTYSGRVVEALASSRADLNALAHTVIIRLATALLLTLVRHSA